MSNEKMKPAEEGRVLAALAIGKEQEGFTPLESKLLTLLDRIEVEEDPTLAGQRFAIAEEFGYTVEFTGTITSGSIN